MLDFLRKYQKLFFLVIATVVISSFVFFGTFSAFTQGPTRQDRVIGKAVDGSDLKLLEIAALSRFLSSDQQDAALGFKNVPPNLLNDGVIRKDFLGSGVASVFAKENFEELKVDLEQRAARIKTFRSYEHPDAPFLSAKAVWQRFVPEMIEQWSLLQAQGELDDKSFETLARLYLLQSSLPAEWMRRILMMYEQQYKWIRPDPRLRQDDLSIFGFHSISDWFGKNFVDGIAVFIHNAAIIAEENGIVASLADAKADLRRNFAEAQQKFEEMKIPILSYQDQLRVLGMDESESATVWRKVLLFRRYFSDLGNSVFLDKLPYEEFAAIANEKANIAVYQWPAALRMSTPLDLYKFQSYLKAVASMDKNDPLALPKTFLPLEAVESRHPELVATRFKANVFAVDKREAALKASLKEVWAFEVEEETWKKLKTEFSFLQTSSPQTDEQRLATLETLEPVQRSKVDAYARRLLVDRHPEWVKEALDGAKCEEKELVACVGRIALPGIPKDSEFSKALGTLFEQILAEPERTLSALSQFEANDAVYRFENIERVQGPHIKTFAEALQDGSIEALATQQLEAEFPKLRIKLPPEQAAKEFSDVKGEVAELLLQDLRKKIQEETVSIEGDVPFAAKRLAGVASQAIRSLQQNPEDPEWVQRETDDPLVKQFKLERTEKQVPRSAQEDWMAKQPFALLPDQWSPVHVDAQQGNVTFFYLKDRQMSSEPIVEHIATGKQLLSADVQRVVAEKVLAAMKKQQAVMIPRQIEQESN